MERQKKTNILGRVMQVIERWNSMQIRTGFARWRKLSFAGRSQENSQKEELHQEEIDRLTTNFENERNELHQSKKF